MTIVKDPKKLKAALDAKHKDGITTVLEESIDETLVSGEAVVAAFFEEIDLDDEVGFLEARYDARFDTYSIITEYEHLQKKKAGKLAKFELLPSVVAFDKTINELHKKHYVTHDLTFGKMPQIAPTGPTSKRYNALKLRRKEALARFIDAEIKPIDVELANRKAEYLEAKKLDREEQEVWKSGREQKSS